MLELIKYFRILFMSPKISRTRLKGFCDYHIIALTQHNPGGVFTQLLNDVTAAYNAYYSDLVSASINESVKQGKTQGMNESRAALEKNISDNEKLVAYTYRDNESVYQEFYPHGVFEYYKASIGVLETISDRYRQVLAARAGDFPLAFSTQYNTLHATFIANRQAQLASMGDVSRERSDLATSRPELTKQLTKNLLLIAAHFIGDDSKCNVYFDASLLRDAFRENRRTVTEAINPSETHLVFHNVRKSSLRITLKNEGEQPLYFGFTDNAEDAVSRIKVEAGQTETYTAADLGWTSEKKFFNASNMSAEASKYKVNKYR